MMRVSRIIHRDVRQYRDRRGELVFCLVLKDLDYRCVPYKKKYVVAYLSQEKEIVICDFVAAKL